MSNLINTLWNINCPGTQIGSEAILFLEGGKAIMAFPDGTTAKGTWVETHKGHFVLQLPDPVVHPDVRQMYCGAYEEDKGNGQLYDIDNILCAFTMRRES